MVIKEFKKEIKWGFYSKGIAFFFLFLFNILLTRTLDVERYGKWTFFYSLMMIFLLLSNLGIIDSSRKFVAQYSKSFKLNRYISTSLLIKVVSGLITSIIIIVITQGIVIITKKEYLSPLLYLSAIFIPLLSQFEYFKGIAMGLHKIKIHFFLNAVNYFFNFIITLIVLQFTTDLKAILISLIISLIISNIQGFLLIFKKVNLKFQKSVAKDIINYSLPMFLISIGFLIATEIDTIMIGFLSNDFQLGIYGVAKQITIKIPHISIAIAMGVMPTFAKMNKGNKDKLKKLFLKIIKINTLIILPIIFGILLFSNILIPFIFGNDFSSAALPLQILTVYILCYSYSSFISSFLDYQGLAKKRFFNLILSLGINIFLNLLLIPKHGAVGAAIATSIAYVPYVIMNYLEVHRRFLTI